MRHRGALSVLVLVFGLFSGTAQAANDAKTEITQNTDNAQQIEDREGVTWESVLNTTVSQDDVAESHDSKDDTRKVALLKWKEKQKHLWSSLSQNSFVINASAYTAAADECGKSDGITASGVKVAKNRTLACPPQYPFGVKIEIDGYGVYVCEDRGGAIKGNHFDIYMETKKEAFAFGRRNLSAKIVE